MKYKYKLDMMFLEIFLLRSHTLVILLNTAINGQRIIIIENILNGTWYFVKKSVTTNPNTSNVGILKKPIEEQLPQVLVVIPMIELENVYLSTFIYKFLNIYTSKAINIPIKA